MFTVQSLAEKLLEINPDLPIAICDDVVGYEYTNFKIIVEKDKVLLVPCEPEDD